MPPTPDAFGIDCTIPQLSPRVLYANHSQNARTGSSQHCLKSRRDPRDDRLFHWHCILANSDDGLCLESTLWNESRTELHDESRRDYDYNPESWLHHYRATMAIDNRHDEEDVDGAMSSKGGDNHLYTTNSYQQLQSPPGGNLPRDVPWSQPVKSYRQVDKPTSRQSTETRTDKSTISTKILLKPRVESAIMKSTGVTEVDFQRWLPNHDEYTSQCQVPMSIGCEIYSAEHAEALHRAQTAPALLNFVSTTILEKLTC